jgi:acyl-CoA thioesterase-1
MRPKHHRAIILITLFLGLVGACERAPYDDVSKNTISKDAHQGVIVCIGDSLTAGQGVDESDAFPALLAERLRQDGYNYNVINAGVSGETSSGALARLDWTLTLEPDIVILETGANDGLRAVDPALIKRNIEAIVTRLKADGIVVLLAGMQMVRNLGPTFTKAFGAIYPDVAAAHDLILMPFILEGVAGRAHLNQPDGIHPTAEGYRIITANLYPYVIQAVQRHQED